MFNVPYFLASDKSIYTCGVKCRGEKVVHPLYVFKSKPGYNADSITTQFLATNSFLPSNRVISGYDRYTIKTHCSITISTTMKMTITRTIW